MPSGDEPATTATPLPRLGWDEEERRAAWEQAQEIAAHDLEAAEALMAQLRAEAGEPPLPGDAPAVRPRATPPYDPVRFRSELMTAYPGMTWQACGRLHFPCAFGLMREAALRAERERKAYDDAARKGRHGYGGSGEQAIDPDDLGPGGLGALAPRPRVWEGATAGLDALRAQDPTAQQTMMMDDLYARYPPTR